MIINIEIRKRQKTVSLKQSNLNLLMLAAEGQNLHVLKRRIS